MVERIAIIGLDEPEYTDIKQYVDRPIMANEVIPGIVVKDGQLLMQPLNRLELFPVSKVIFHGIFEDDLDFVTGLALWGGPCLPNAQAMLDCRLKLPCLARALQYTHFAAPQRGYASAGVMVTTEDEYVAKWGNWHCGENKMRFTGSWRGEQPSVIEPFLAGKSVRVVIIGDGNWQINLEGESWLKSIHDPHAAFTEVDPELLEDTQRVREGFGLEIIANDYIVTPDGSKHLLEVNHIPNVTRFADDSGKLRKDCDNRE